LKPQKKRTFSFFATTTTKHYKNTLPYHFTFNLITSNQGYDSFYSFNCVIGRTAGATLARARTEGGKAQAVRRYQEGQRS